MSESKTLPLKVQGLWCAIATPFNGQGNIDKSRFVEHAQWLLANGVDGIAPFGTTGEGPSLSSSARSGGLDALLGAGIPSARMVPATGCAAIAETIALTKLGAQANCAACLVLPPFFFKGVSDDGLFSWFAQVIEGVADSRLRVLLYHIPQMSGVAIPVDVVARLATAFPDTVAGVKDSGGVWEHTAALLDRVPQLSILVGREPHLPQLMRAGGAGTICAMANAYPDLVRALMSPEVSAEDEARMAIFKTISANHPSIPGLKAMIAAQKADDIWSATLPPLVPLAGAAKHLLLSALSNAGMPAAR